VRLLRTLLKNKKPSKKAQKINAKNKKVKYKEI